MKLQSECVECILGQAQRVASIIGADAALTKAIHEKALSMSKAFSFEQTPPEVATPMYEALAVLAQKEDLYKEAKHLATAGAKALVPHVEDQIERSFEPLLTAGKYAVAGNVIDLATELVYDLETEIDTVLGTPFAIDDWKELLDALEGGESLLYLADNAGEHIFDLLFIKRIKKSYPSLRVMMMTRGNAIINDVTLEEARAAGVEVYADLASSGVSTPGFVFSQANERAKASFLESDIVVAKGMGNYETLTEISMRPVFHLFKVKCGVVSRDMGHPIGSLICMKR